MDSKNFAVRIAKKWKSGWQDSCSNDIDLLVIKNSDDAGKYFALLFINYIYSDRCFELWICIGICKRMWSNDNNWDGIWCKPDFIPFLGKSLETLVDKLLSMTNE